MIEDKLCEKGVELLNEGKLTEALACFRKAETTGSGEAAHYLALCYDRGYGVEVSKSRALAFYKKALDRGFEGARIHWEYLEHNPDFVNMVDGGEFDDGASVLRELREKCASILEYFNGSGGDMGVLRGVIQSGGDDGVADKARELDTLASIAPRFECRYGENLHIGAYTHIAPGCYIDDSASVYIGSHVGIERDVKIITASQEDSGKARSAPVHIGNRVRIECGAVICPGVTIGEGAVIYANAVVRGNVPPHHSVAGPGEVSGLAVGVAPGKGTLEYVQLEMERLKEKFADLERQQEEQKQIIARLHSENRNLRFDLIDAVNELLGGK